MRELRWFKPKDFGYGFTPAGWEGCVVTAVWCALLALATLGLRRFGHGAVAAADAGLFASLLILAQRTGAKGWWRGYRSPD
jgi:hypothetical protein